MQSHIKFETKLKPWITFVKLKEDYLIGESIILIEKVMFFSFTWG